MMQNAIIKIYQRLFVRRRLYRLHKLLYALSLRGLGILNYENGRISGENHFIQRLSQELASPVVVDVGANVGAYSGMVKTYMPTARIHAFEPHPTTYERLKHNAARDGYSAYNLGLGAARGSVTLYDYQGRDEGTSHASMHQGVIERLHGGRAQEWTVQLTTLDHFLAEQSLQHIDLLKVDTEGHELSVLQGARQCLHDQRVDLIHFEFNEMNTVSRVFFMDYYELLDGFSFHRMLPDGLVPIGDYSPPFCEIFAFQNIVAVRPGHAMPVQASAR